MLVERKSLLDVQAARKGKAPNCSFPFTARCFAAILPSFLLVRGCTSPQSLHFLVFPWPNRVFSMGYREKNKKTWLRSTRA
jgi:hypothetical protein